MLAQDIDPSEDRKDRKRAKLVASSNSFEAVARQWLAKWSNGKSPRHVDYVRRRLEMDVFPEIGSKPVTAITAPMLVAMVRKIEQRGALDIAKRAWQTCSMVFRDAVAEGLTERNPAKDVLPSDILTPRKKSNYARLDAKELPELLRKIEAYEGQPLTRLAMKLMALTFVRTSELIGARW